MGEFALWFGEPGQPVAGWLELPAGGTARAGVVLCPALLGEGTNAYRSFRLLSADLAERGLAVLRIDYPGTGDSAGRSDEPDMVRRWIGSAVEAVEVLRRRGLAHVTLVGLRVGAILAGHAAAQGGADALVLWDPALSGRRWLRQQIMLTQVGLAHLQAADQDVLGVRLPAATEAELARLDLSQVPVCDRPTLVVGRADRPRPEVLRERWAAAQWWDGDEQPALLEVDSLAARPAVVTVAAIASWIGKVAPLGPMQRVVEPDADERVATFVDRRGVRVAERFVRLGPDGLAGVITAAVPEVPGPVTVLFLNTAAERHIGPERAWVDVSRELAGRGLRCVRFDLGGIGDSPTPPGRRQDESYEPAAVHDVVRVVTELGGDPDSTVLVGLCSGAYHAIEGALALRVLGVVAVNPVPERSIVREPRGASKMPPGLRTSPAWVRRLGRTPILRDWQESFPDALWSLLHVLRLVSNPAGPLRRLERNGTRMLLLAGDLELRPYMLRGGRDMRWLLTRPQFRLVQVEELDHSMLRRGPREQALELLTAHLLGYTSLGAVAGAAGG